MKRMSKFLQLSLITFTIASLAENSLNPGCSLSDHTIFDQSGTAPLTGEIGKTIIDAENEW